MFHFQENCLLILHLEGKKRSLLSNISPSKNVKSIKHLTWNQFDASLGFVQLEYRIELVVRKGTYKQQIYAEGEKTQEKKRNTKQNSPDSRSTENTAKRNSAREQKKR